MIINKYGLLGYSLKHTLSPFVHGRLFELSKIPNSAYDIIDLSPDKLAKEINNLNLLCGYNITIPHKCEIIKYLDNLDESALKYDAVNCVLNKNGVSTGYNTDCYGFTKSLEADNIALNGKVLILGFGGAGRMMALEAALSGADVTIAVRDITKPVIPQNFDIAVCDINNISGKFDLIVNSTPVGMYPNIDACPVSDGVIKNSNAIFDAVYNPKDTLLLKKAKEFGVKAIGGMAMLIWQAAKAHNIWYNAEFSDNDIAKIIEKANNLL